MVETVIAMMVFTAVGTAVLTGLSISLRTGEDTERKAISEGLSRTEMEYIASLAYENPPVDYAISPSIVLPPGYAITATGSEENAGDQNLQRIVVVVSFGGVDTLRLETFRTKVN